MFEAARIDGTSEWQIYKSLVIPLMRPALATVAIFNMIKIWNDFWFPLVFIRTVESRTVALGVLTSVRSVPHGLDSRARRPFTGGRTDVNSLCCSVTGIYQRFDCGCCQGLSFEKNMKRCEWCGTDPLYTAYHDEEWGVPVHDDGLLFEYLCLGGAQAGLSWLDDLEEKNELQKGFSLLRLQAYRQVHRSRSDTIAG